MDRTVFFADVLGFSSLSTRDDGRAVDSLADLALLLSTEHPVARYLQRCNWEQRFALSDSVFLVAEDTPSACIAAAEFFFNLAYYNAGHDSPVLLRGALAHGPVRYTSPIFPTTATSNLVGGAVVEAVTLEKSPRKGPRLFLSRTLADTLTQSPHAWLVHDEDAVSELLWLLPSDIKDVNEAMLTTVCKMVLRLFQTHGRATFGHHYAGYVDLALHSLMRLSEYDQGLVQRITEASGFRHLNAHSHPLITRLLS